MAGKPQHSDDGVWPTELQVSEAYTRAGKGSLSGEDIKDVRAEFRRTDFDGQMRDFNFDRGATLTDLASCYKYWIALTDCDGFRMDTLKHVDTGVARSFCGILKEFASNLGKTNFFLVGEVGGPDDNAQQYRDILKSNLNATLDIGDSRVALTAVAKGLAPASNYFNKVAAWDDQLGSHRDAGLHHVIILDDHDHVFGQKVRFSSDAASPLHVVAGVAIQLFSLGIPCIYYGTEQSFAGPPRSQRDKYLPDYGTRTDWYLRETMFGGSHPRKAGEAGAGTADTGIDNGLPGFAAFGALGCDCFRKDFPTFLQIKRLIGVRSSYPALRFGRQYLREIAKEGRSSFSGSNSGDIFAWSRVLDDEEALKDINARTAAKLRVIGSTVGNFNVDDLLDVKRERDGRAYVEIGSLGLSGVIVLSSRPKST